MKKTAILSVFFFLAALAYSQTAIQQFVNNPALKHASVGVQVTELKTGKTIVSHDAQKSLTPASVTKIITSATALELLGENYRYATRVALDENDPSRILVLGSGDPTLGSDAFGDNTAAFFINAADALKKELSADKEYSIYVVDNLFGYDGISPEWTWIDIGNYYASGTYGISVFDNSYKLFFNTSDRNASPRILRTEPEMKKMQFSNFLTLNTSGSDNGYIYGVPFSYERTIRGNIPGGRTEFSIKGDIPDPGLFLGETLADYLTRSGIKIGRVETARVDYIARNPVTYKIGKVVHTQTSRPMKDILQEVNVKSNNHYAEHLLRIIGRTQNADIYSDPLQAGIDYVKKFWEQQGVSTTSLTLYDGSGLAPQNAFSPAFLNEIIVYMYSKSKNSKVFFDSLPKAGRDGTLRNFLRGTKYEGKISAKSGSIGGVQCYSGYLIDGNKQYAFTVMVNKFNGTRSQVRSAIEKFLLSL
ncbi:D-alanyl-D-alanine carboxypeptidase/D-alanyl-D-alanine endopeptidase [Petrimonas sp.]|uniref:D-alanyl-D-alanine carboxypeptidase/D-alanyl-D-alanine endopeptidase n=1 Tax=Petrimonas sp. TaxID=2023866 RepID=UPI003F51A565